MTVAGTSFWFEAASATHVGRVRTLNEDRFVARPEIGVFAVADGMGGHDNGEVASSTIARLVEGIRPTATASGLLAGFEDRIIEANREVLDYARRHNKGTVGSTVAALLIHSGFFACVWCGDSRVYLLRRGALEQLTRDHNEANDLVERGVLTEEEAAVWPRRNVLTRAIGVAPEPELEMEQGPVMADDLFVLCSDGLTGHVSDAEILAIVSHQSPAAAVKALIALALERGGTDNVTVVIVGCRVRAATPARPAERRPRDVWE